jgi:hypothetical protein
MQYLQKVRSAGVFYPLFRIKPLRVIKQSFVCLPARTVQNFGGPNRNSLTSFGIEKRGTCPTTFACLPSIPSATVLAHRA